MYHFFSLSLFLSRCCFFYCVCVCRCSSIYLARLLDLNWKQNVLLHCICWNACWNIQLHMIPKFFLMPLIFTDFNSNGNFSTGIPVGYVPIYTYISIFFSVYLIHTWEKCANFFLCASPHWANTSLNMNGDMHSTNHSAIRVAFSVCLKEYHI